VAAGAIAIKALKSLGITVTAYTESIADIKIDTANADISLRDTNALYMPDADAYKRADEYVTKLMSDCDSAGGAVACVVEGMPAGVGEPVFDKLDANLGKALFSIGAVKAVEIGAGTNAALMLGSVDNDSFKIDNGKVTLTSNNGGGILGGISDGADIFLRATFKATPSIAKQQRTINRDGE
jgi:chorismate synthase